MAANSSSAAIRDLYAAMLRRRAKTRLEKAKAEVARLEGAADAAAGAPRKPPAKKTK